MKRTLTSILVATVATLVLAGFTTRAHATTLFSDNFANDSTFNTNLWTSVKGNPRIWNHRLLLESTPGNGCDATTKATFIYPTTGNKIVQVEIKTPSYAWAEDTSIGFETWNPVHCGVLVTTGCLACINHQLSGGISNQEVYISIPNWSNLKSGDNTYLIKWTSGSVQLYINGVYSCGYSGPQVPSVPANIRMNSSNDYNDNLQVAYCTVSNN